ncbi:MAG: lysylphosphatidylglycerol synthase transmembrane domain-containing protein [Bacteroidales bacterium]
MNTPLKKGLQFSSFFLLTCFFLWYSFKDISLEKLWIDLKSANYAWVLFAILLGLIAYLARALRWQLLIAPLGYNAKLRSVFNAVAIGYFANFLFPRLGEVARCGALSKTDSIPLDKLVGTVIAERVFDFICLLTIFCLAIVLKIDTFGVFIQQNLFAKLNAPNFFGEVLFIFLAIFTVFIFFLGIFRKKIVKLSPVQRGLYFLKGIIEGLKSFAQIQKRLQFTLHTLIIWTCYWAMALVLLYAIPTTEHLSPIDGLVVMLLGSLGIVLPTNGGLGAFHAIISIGMYAIYGIAREDGMAYATISHESQMLFMLIVGLLAYLQLFLFTKEQSK